MPAMPVLASGFLWSRGVLFEQVPIRVTLTDKHVCLLYSIILLRCVRPVRVADVLCTWSPEGAASHWWLTNSHLPHIRIKIQTVKTIITRENHYWRPVLVTSSLNQSLFLRDNMLLKVPIMGTGNSYKRYERKTFPRWPSYNTQVAESSFQHR